LAARGRIGSKLAGLLGPRRHEVLQAAPSKGVNAVTGEGLQQALAGADIVVDVSNSPSFEDKAVLDFFETGRASRTLVPDDGARIMPTRFDEWLSSAAKTA
jgi:hypothetical protein